MEQNGNEHICVCIFWGGSGAEKGRVQEGPGDDFKRRPILGPFGIGRRSERNMKKRRVGGTARDLGSYFVIHSFSTVLYLAAIFSWPRGSPANAKTPFAIYLSCIKFRHGLPGVSYTGSRIFSLAGPSVGLEAGGRPPSMTAQSVLIRHKGKSLLCE